MRELSLSLLRDFLTWSAVTKGHTPATTRMYRRIMCSFVEEVVGDGDYDGVSVERVEKWLQRPRDGRSQGMVAMPATQHRDAACLRTFYGWATARGHLRTNPAALVETPTIRNKQPRPIGDAVWLALWGQPMTLADRCTLGLGFFLGLRREEITRLRKLHLDIGGKRLVNFTRKGGGEDVMPAGTALAVFEKHLPHLVGGVNVWDALVQHTSEKGPSDFVVGWHDLGRPRARAESTLEAGQLDPQHLNHWLDRLVAQANARGEMLQHLHPHMLRHSFATNMIRAGVPLTTVSGLMNHSNISTTARYVKSGGDALAEWLNNSDV